MSSFFAGRRGLAGFDQGGRVGSTDLTQMVDMREAMGLVLSAIVGGEGIYEGGATLLADIATGTQYPAVTIVVNDDSGYPRWFKTTSATAITFNETSTAAGDARLYAVPTMLSGVTPAAADGRYNQVRFVCDDVANAEPAHSLLLGTGTVTASALTAFTAGSTAPTVPALAGIAKLASANTFTGAVVFRTAASDPQHATPGSRPAGVVGEVVFYSAKLYFCTNATTPTWELITSS